MVKISVQLRDHSGLGLPWILEHLSLTMIQISKEILELEMPVFKTSPQLVPKAEGKCTKKESMIGYKGSQSQAGRAGHGTLYRAVMYRC